MKLKTNTVATVNGSHFVVRCYGSNKQYVVSYILFDKHDNYVTGKAFILSRMYEAMQLFGRLLYRAYIHEYDEKIKEKIAKYHLTHDVSCDTF